MFFAKCGKNEVRMGNGKEVALGLGALGRAFAPDAAGTDGDQRLLESGSRCPWGSLSGLMKLVRRAF